MTGSETVESVTADLADRINQISARYPTKRSAIMPALYLAQEKYGALGGVIYQAIAEILKIPEIYVFEVASFYTMYNRQEVGRFHIQLCTNVSCMLLGAYDLLGHLEKRLGIREGATTANDLFTLTTVECIGACDVAPTMMINDTYHNNLTKEELDGILDGLEKRVGENPIIQNSGKELVS